jgi:hypothetical protein
MAPYSENKKWWYLNTCLVWHMGRLDSVASHGITGWHGWGATAGPGLCRQVPISGILVRSLLWHGPVDFFVVNKQEYNNTGGNERLRLDGLSRIYGGHNMQPFHRSVCPSIGRSGATLGSEASHDSSGSAVIPVGLPPQPHTKDCMGTPP